MLNADEQLKKVQILLQLDHSGQVGRRIVETRNIWRVTEGHQEPQPTVELPGRPRPLFEARWPLGCRFEA